MVSSSAPMLFNPNAKYYKGDVLSAPSGVRKKVRALLLEIQYTQCLLSRTCTRTSPSPSYPYSAQCGNVLVLYTHSSACVVTSLTARASRIRDFPSRPPLLSSRAPLLARFFPLLSSFPSHSQSSFLSHPIPLSHARTRTQHARVRFSPVLKTLVLRIVS